jgi:hypothetical protein
MKTKTLVEIGASGTCGDLDKGSDVTNPIFPGHTYLEVYDQLFKPYNRSNTKLLELGFQYGPSMRLWWEYFESTSLIHGIDICDYCTIDRVYYNIAMQAFPTPRVLESTDDLSNVILNIVDSTDPVEYLDSIKDIKFDIIIDDASHYADHMAINFKNFIGKLHNDGIYIIEDMAGPQGFANGHGPSKWEGVDYIKSELSNIGYNLNIIDMSHPDRDDNVLGIVYNANSKHSDYFDSYISSQEWLINPKCNILYSKEKQQQLLRNGIQPWIPQHVNPKFI